MITSDEELTELECVIDDYCKSSIRQLVVGDELYSQWCPLYAVAGGTNTKAGINKLGLFESEGNGFWRGFDNSTLYDEDDARFYEMGKRFRERVIAGEYRKEEF